MISCTLWICPWSE